MRIEPFDEPQRVGPERIVGPGRHHRRQVGLLPADRRGRVPGRVHLLLDHLEGPDRRGPALGADAHREGHDRPGRAGELEEAHLGEVHHHPPRRRGPGHDPGGGEGDDRARGGDEGVLPRVGRLDLVEAQVVLARHLDERVAGQHDALAEAPR